MGLFTRKDPGNAQPGKPRPSVSSEAQAAQLRGRARRRLAGAVALVLAAVIVLPMVLDSEPVQVAENIPIRIPDRNAPFQPSVSEPQVALPTLPQAEPPPDTAGPAQPPQPPQTAAAPPPTSVAPPSEAHVTPKAEPKAPAKPQPEPAAPAEPPRSDDGARALALLEGRQSPPPAAKSQVEKGNFVLQVASYSTQGDAQTRRDKLHQAGITNAFVAPATVGGKQQYRLRVGPFPSRDAAQAAQARLRTLGYDNGFIAAQ